MSRLPRPCLTCGRLIPAGSRCRNCAAGVDALRGTSSQRGYGSAWRRTSARIIKRDGGLCQLRLPGCTYFADTTDHIVARVHGGTDHESNLQAACRSCNSGKRDRI